MAIIDRVKYDGPPGVLVWRHPPDDLSAGAQVIVNQSQEAVFYKGGQALDVLGPGTHKLDTANVPLLRAFLKLPFGGKTPFAAEVYFVNKAVNMDVKWGTNSPLPLMDPKYNVPIPVRAFGQMAVRVADSARLVAQLVGTASELTAESLQSYFRGAILTRAKDHLAEVFRDRKLSFLEIGAQLEELSSELHRKFREDFERYGVELVNFYLNSVDVPEGDETVARLKRTLAEKAEMDILGMEAYKAKRAFEAMEKSGGAGAGLGLAAGLGAGAQMGGMVSSALSGAACPSCKASAPAGSKFCPGCGAKLPS